MKIRKPRQIAAARRARHDRQADVAAKVGVSQQHISRIEHGQVTDCSLRLARALTRYLGLDFDEVFAETTPTRLRVRTIQRQDRKPAKKVA